LPVRDEQSLTLARDPHLEATSDRSDALPRGRGHCFELLIVVFRIVMEEHQRPNSRSEREVDAFAHAAVAPTDTLGVLVIVELGVQDQQVRAANELDELMLRSS
jgi:hypothetical protein